MSVPNFIFIIGLISREAVVILSNSELNILVSSCVWGCRATELWCCRHRGTTLTIRRSPGQVLYPAQYLRWMMITRGSGVLCRALTTLSQVISPLLDNTR